MLNDLTISDISLGKGAIFVCSTYILLFIVDGINHVGCCHCGM
jgi:hypothetical protein